MPRKAAEELVIVSRGGARSRSGPQPDPTSGRSDRRGFVLTALPNEGYAGDVPVLTDFIPEPAAREVKVWSQLWSTPQACAWSQQAWRWSVVADLARYMVRSEDPDAPVALATAVRQLRDDCGLSEAGLKANGWSIAPVDIAPAEPKTAAPARKSARDRMKVVPGVGAGA